MNPASRRRPQAAVMAAALWALAAPAFTADRPADAPEREGKEGLYERAAEALKLHEDDESAAIQELSVIGRYHGQYWSVSADQGSADDWENRRLYLGVEARFLRRFSLHAQIKTSDDLDPFYDGLYQAFVEWSATEALSLRLGRIDFLFAGLERSASSNRIVTIERGLLVNQVMPGEVVGALLEGKSGDWSYRAGLLSGSIDDEFTDFDGGSGAVAGAGYSLPLFYESGRINLDYLYNDGHRANNALAPYDHVLSLWHQGKAGRLGLGVDLTWGHGLDSLPAVFSATILPTYLFRRDLIRNGDALQGVIRYQVAVSDGDNGLQLQPRYEGKVVSAGLGNRYQAVYAGINYLILDDRLKLMTGAEYSEMRDSAHDGGEFDGWTYLAGVRMYF